MTHNIDSDDWITGYILAQHDKLNQHTVDDAEEFWQGFKCGIANLAEYDNLDNHAFRLIPENIRAKIEQLKNVTL